MKRFVRAILQGLQRLPTAVWLSYRIYRFTVLDDDEAARYLARHPELRDEPARALLLDNLARADRRGNLPAMRRMHARLTLAVTGELPPDPSTLEPLDGEEITRRHYAAMARARTDDPAELEEVLVELEMLTSDPRFAVAPADVRAPVLADAGALWMLHFELSGDPDDLGQARMRLQLAALLSEAHPVQQGLVLSNLAIVESRSFHLTGRVEHLQDTVNLLRRATATEPHPSAERASHLINLGTALMELHSATLVPGMLDESIDRFREAAPFQEGMSLDERSVYLRGVGSALLTRFRIMGQMADVHEAIRALRQMLVLPDVMAHDRSLATAVLGYGLLQQARAEGLPGSAEEAVRVLREGVGLAGENPLTRLNALSGLGRAYRVLYDLTGERERLDDAVANLALAAGLAPEGSHWQVRTLSDFGEALTTRSRAAARGKGAEDGAAAARDLELAIRMLGEADKRARTPEVGGRLAAALSLRAGTTGASWTHGRARALFMYACEFGQVEVALPAGAAWGEWALRRSRWREAEAAYAHALRASDALFAVQAARSHKEGALRPVRGLAAGAAYAAARADNLGRAVEIMEHGRTRIVAEALRLGGREAVQLERQAPALAQRLRGAAETLASLSALEEGATVAPAEGLPGTLAERVVQARAELDAVLAEIRDQPGLEVFGAPLSLPRIAEVGRPAPLVYLAVSPAGGMALIVEGNGAIHPVWLPRLDTAAVRERMEGAYIPAYRAWRDDRQRRGEWARVLDETLCWAWDAMMGPVLAALGERGHHAAMLVVPGLLQFIPLHAAWTEDPAGAHGRRVAQDGAMLACAPSARLLAAVRQPRPAGGSAILLVDNPDYSLQGADADRIAELGGFDFQTSLLLYGEHATREAVLAALPDADVVQFTTHGEANPGEPLRSGVLLADAWLEVEEILEAPLLDRAPLVFLSACETTLPGTGLPDEVVSLPTAFLQAGAGGVIASLWPVPDEATGEMELAFYARLGAGDSPAEALHRVRAELRAAHPDPSEWAAFTYTGRLG